MGGFDLYAETTTAVDARGASTLTSVAVDFEEGSPATTVFLEDARVDTPGVTFLATRREETRFLAGMMADDGTSMARVSIHDSIVGDMIGTTTEHVGPTIAGARRPGSVGA